MVVRYAKRFHKDLRNTPVDIQKRVLEVVEKLLAADNLASSGVDYKRMEGQKPDEQFYRLRIGDWRIGLEYIHPEVALLRILARGNVYRSFPPKS